MALVAVKREGGRADGDTVCASRAPPPDVRTTDSGDPGPGAVLPAARTAALVAERWILHAIATRLCSSPAPVRSSTVGAVH